MSMEKTFAIPYNALTVGKWLGGGGFGNVHQGEYQHAPVAIKLLKGQAETFGFNDANADKVLEEFQRETTLMAQLKHPCIVTLYGACYEPDRYAMVMEYMPKGSLYHVLYSKEALSWKTRYQIGVDITMGVAYLHYEGVVHGDLKSLNVLLDELFHAKITDFGLSKLKLSSSATLIGPGTSMSTIRWMAPELFEEEAKTTKASDAYSCGIILWELGARHLPFAKKAPNDMQVARLLEKGMKEEIHPDTPPVMAKLIDRCWERDTSKRPPMDEAVKALKQEFSTYQFPELPVSVLPGQPSSGAGAVLTSVTASPNKALEQEIQQLKQQLAQQTAALKEKELVLSQRATALKEHESKLKQHQEKVKELTQAISTEQHSSRNKDELIAQQQKELQRIQQDLGQIEPLKKDLAKSKEQERQLKIEFEAYKANPPKPQSPMLKPKKPLGSDYSPPLFQSEPKKVLSIPEQVEEMSNATKKQKQMNEGQIKVLLKWVTEGHLLEVEKLLKNNLSLGVCTGTVADRSDRTFKNITALQYAAWSLDREMCDLIMGYLGTHNSAIQLKALYSEPHRYSQHGDHYDIKPLIEKTKKYVENCEKWWKENREECQRYWQKEVGGEQRKCPAWLIYAWSEEGKDVAWMKQDFSRKIKREYEKNRLDWWFTENYNNGRGVGTTLTIVRGSLCCAIRRAMSYYITISIAGRDTICQEKLNKTGDELLAKLKSQSEALTTTQVSMTLGAKQ